MSRQRILSIEYIRGLSMLGVIGIHTGAYSLTNPDVNIHLFALLEIVTRFSVPIFFFVSAFGLFLHHDLQAPFNYVSFMKKRCRTVLVPYIVWSLLYMLHYTYISGDISPWFPGILYKYFLFGLASYQLYFLVILLWFYSFMPLWRILVRKMIGSPRLYLSVLLVLQIAVNYYSSYILEANFSNHYINLAVQYRLSYWIIHYLFIFLLGAVCAIHYQQFIIVLKKHRTAITCFFCITLLGMISFYYHLLVNKHYTPEGAVNTVHQLSPIGVLYTLATTLFLLLLFEVHRPSPAFKAILAQLGERSYAVYLVHPFIMYYLIYFLNNHAIVMNVPVVLLFYLCTVAFSLMLSWCIQWSSQFLPAISRLLTGSAAKK